MPSQRQLLERSNYVATPLPAGRVRWYKGARAITPSSTPELFAVAQGAYALEYLAAVVAIAGSNLGSRTNYEAAFSASFNLFKQPSLVLYALDGGPGILESLAAESNHHGDGCDECHRAQPGFQVWPDQSDGCGDQESSQCPWQQVHADDGSLETSHPGDGDQQLSAEDKQKETGPLISKMNVAGSNPDQIPPVLTESRPSLASDALRTAPSKRVSSPSQSA